MVNDRNKVSDKAALCFQEIPRYRSGLSALLVLSLVNACASTVTKLPEEFSSSAKVKVKLESRGQILAATKLKKGGKCEPGAKSLKLEVQSDKGKSFSTSTSCTLVPGHLTAYTTVPLAKGEYRVKATSENEAKLSVRYSDADFASGADQDFGGATELAENQSVKGTVNYLAGDATDWVKAKGGAMMLTLLEDGEGTTAFVYKLAKGGSDPTALGEIKNKQKKKFRLDKGEELLVKVLGDKFKEEGSYTLIRRDLTGSAAGGKKESLGVIDAYPLTDTSSLVLLRAVAKMKVDDEIEITGMRASGAPLKLGKCRVGSVADGQASCRLDRVLPSDLVEYRAEAVLGGGET